MCSFSLLLYYNMNALIGLILLAAAVLATFVLQHITPTQCILIWASPTLVHLLLFCLHIFFWHAALQIILFSTRKEFFKCPSRYLSCRQSNVRSCVVSGNFLLTQRLLQCLLFSARRNAYTLRCVTYPWENGIFILIRPFLVLSRMFFFTSVLLWTLISIFSAFRKICSTIRCYRRSCHHYYTEIWKIRSITKCWCLNWVRCYVSDYVFAFLFFWHSHFTECCLKVSFIHGMFISHLRYFLQCERSFVWKFYFYLISALHSMPFEKCVRLRNVGILAGRLSMWAKFCLKFLFLF